MEKTLGTTLSSTTRRRCRGKRPLFKKHTFFYVPVIQNLVAMLSNEDLRKALLEGQCKRLDGKLEYLQDGIVLTNHPLFSGNGGQASAVVSVMPDMIITHTPLPVYPSMEAVISNLSVTFQISKTTT